MTPDELKANHLELYSQIRSDLVEEVKAKQQENVKKV